jgi:ketosteroid isomerase-like protein
MERAYLAGTVPLRDEAHARLSRDTAQAMSRDNVELHHRVIDAFTRRDLGAYLALMDPEVEFTPYEVWVQGGEPYRGHAGVRSWWEESFAVFPDLRAEVHEVRDFGDRTFASGRIYGQGAGSGASIERAMWLANEWRTQKVVWWSAFGSEAEALEAAGLSD